MHRLYAVSVYVSIVAIFGGVSSVAPANFVEYCALSFMMMVGGLAWAYVLSMLCSIFSKLNPRETDYKNLMDELNYFMEERDFDDDHRQRLRDFFTFTRDFSHETGYSEIFTRMSNKLRADTALIIGKDALYSVWYLRENKCEKGYLCEVALNMKPGIFEVREELPLKNLVIISKGLVVRRMQLMRAGTVLAIDCILKYHHHGLRDSDTVVAMSFVQVQSISPDTLFEIAENKGYPQALSSLGRAARHMTIRLALITYYRKFVKLNRKLPGRLDVSELATRAISNQRTFSSKKGADVGGGREYQHHADSGALEKRMDELTDLVRLLITANEGGGGGGGGGGSRGARARSFQRGGSRSLKSSSYKEDARNLTSHRRDSRSPTRGRGLKGDGPGRSFSRGAIARDRPRGGGRRRGDDDSDFDA